MATAVPAWLSERFPGRKEWSTLRSCKLRVDAELGAGLDMEESSENGYLVESVADKPGQDDVLKAGVAIIGINGERLLGLQEDQIGEVFGKHFKQDAEILLASASELRDAEEDAEEEETKPEELANYELLKRARKTEPEQPATVKIPVGRATAWRLDDATMADLQSDLAVVAETFQLSAQPRFNEAGMESIVLNGLPSAIARARSEVVSVLNYYRDGRNLSAGSTGDYGYSTCAPAAAPETAIQVPDHVRDLGQYQYHDHTADIIVQAWGQTRAEAFAQVVVGMFNYMSEVDKVELVQVVEVEAKGHDLLDLLFHLLDEFLYMFGTDMVICRRVEIVSFDEEKFHIKAKGYGERMDLKKHEQGTEIKAITMHMMKIISPDTVLTEHGLRASSEDTDLKRVEGFPHEAYVLLDI
eukprot:TRINITY_DN2579_c0_g1_i1.p1 TRINITY_DN2579_c0_g1~~TRINITY_DN2579_c0_g1_i1.p1  ORF type:complete len:413 (-),score=107.85 TRINITY_DN2579_c0_g1_i1:30-1268(-)